MVTKQLSDLSDQALIQLLHQGDTQAFEEIHKRYWNKLIDSSSKYLRSLEDAKEVVQDVFVSLYIRRDKLQITHSLEAYLTTAAKYKALNYLRSERTRKEYINKIYSRYPFQTDDPARILHMKELNQQINYTVAGLPKKCRQVYTLSRRENFSNKDIADELGISVSTVEKHIVKALKIIRLKLQAS